jgi:4-amino-4-deoxy-L-arabinose transferase-like glycosyltransferase
LTRQRPRAWLGFYGATGLAFWAKGPAGLLPVLALLVWALLEDRRRRFASLALPQGTALLTAIVAPWPLVGAFAHVDGLREAVVNDQLLWYVPKDLHVWTLSAPLQNAFGILFPWVLLTPLVVTQAVRTLRGRGVERDAVHFLLVVSAVVLAAVGVSSQQRVRYYLPLLPPVALLISWWAVGVFVRHRAVARIPYRVYAVMGAALGAAGALTAALRSQTRAQLAATWPAYVALVLVLFAVALVLSAAVALTPPARRRGRAFALACVAAAVAAAGGYRADSHRPSVEDFGRLQTRVQPLGGDARALVVWDVADLPLSFYLHRPTLEVHTAEALTRALDAGAPFAVVAERVVPAGEAGVIVVSRATLGERAVAVLATRQR